MSKYSMIEDIEYREDGDLTSRLFSEGHDFREMCESIFGEDYIEYIDVFDQNDLGNLIELIPQVSAEKLNAKLDEVEDPTEEQSSFIASIREGIETEFFKKYGAIRFEYEG